MISMNLIRRAFALTAATTMAALVTVAASACGAATTTTGPPTNGLEKKSPADVLQAAAAALQTAKSVHVVGTGRSGHLDAHMQHDSATGTITVHGHQLRITMVGGAGYLNTDRAGLMIIGAPLPVQRHYAGRWLKVPASDFTGFTAAEVASQLTTYYGPLEPKVRQATLNGKKVVVVSWRNGSTLHVANTGPPYPIRADFKKGPNAGLIQFSEYGAPLHITAPSDAIDVSKAGY
jgi:hypothetical protein